MYRFCEVHFKRNLCRVAHISKAVDPVKQDRFKQMAMHLVDTEDYREFHRTANQLIVEFPLVASWIKWYLNYGRAFHVFASLRNLSAYEKIRFKRLKKTPMHKKA